MKNDPSSRSLVVRALRRIEKIADRTDLTTQDPLLAEIALAQLDTSLALAQELRAVTAELRATRVLAANISGRVTHVQMAGSSLFESEETRAIRHLQYEVAWLKGELKYMRDKGANTPAEPPT